MNAQRLRAAAQQLSQMERESSTAPDRKGLISSYDPVTHAVKVLLQPEATETGWIPIRTSWAGNGWGDMAGPVLGAQVTISFQEGNRETGEMAGHVFSDVDRPLSVPSGERWIMHKLLQGLKLTNDGGLTFLGSQTGQSLTLNPDGSVVVQAKGGIIVTMAADGTLTLAGATSINLGSGGTMSPVETAAGPSSVVNARV